MSDVNERNSWEFMTKSKHKRGNGVHCLLCETNLQNLSLLKCLHYFCKSCLRSKFHLQLSGGDGKEPFLFSCPLCNFPHKTEKKSDSVDEILNEIYESQLLAAINDQENMLIGTSICLPCKNRSKENVSVSWCYDCRSNLCEKCLMFHDSMPTLVSHTIYSNEEILDRIHLMSSAREICEYHSIRLHMFCITHKTACCNTCIVDNHRSCHLVDLKTHTNSLKDLVQEMRISFSELYCDLSDAMDKNMVEQDFIEKFAKENTQHVNETYASWRRKSLSLTDALTAETYKLFYHEIQIYDTKTTAQKSKIVVLENCKDMLNAYVSTSDVRIFLEKIKIQKIYMHVLEFFKNLNRTNFGIQIQLTVDQKFSVLFVLDSFGRIQSSENPNFVPVMEASCDGKQLEGSEATPSSPRLSRSSSQESLESPYIFFNGKQLSCSISFSIEEGESHVTGCDWVSEDRFIVVDTKTREQHWAEPSNVRIYNLQGKMFKKINFDRSCKPYDVVMLDNKNAAITVPNMRQIRIYDVNSGQMVKRHSTENICYGICKFENDIVVAGQHTILFIKPNGRLSKLLLVNGKDIRYVCAISNDFIFYSSLQDNCVYSVNGSGDEIYCFHSKDTKGAAGLIVDNQRNAYFCEKGSRSLIRLDERGNLKTHIDVGFWPTAIAYSDKYDKICIIRGGRNGCNEAIIYS